MPLLSPEGARHQFLNDEANGKFSITNSSLAQVEAKPSKPKSTWTRLNRMDFGPLVSTNFKMESRTGKRGLEEVLNADSNRDADSSFVDGGWMCIGDFNEMLSSTEKLSSRPISSKPLDDFRDALERCQLVDLGFISYPYTWNNRRPGAANTKERLDRAVANEAWKVKFPETTVTHIISHASDHLPLILQNQVAPKRQARRERGFKFEEAWLLWDDCTKVVQEAWDNSGVGVTALERARLKINGCSSELKAWGAAKTHPGTNKIKVLQKQIEWLTCAPPIIQNRSEFI